MTGLTDDELTPLRIPGERAILMEYDGLPRDMYRQVIAMLRRIHDEEGFAWRDMAWPASTPTPCSAGCGPW